MTVLNIRSVVDVQSQINSIAPTKRDFRNVLFVYKGNPVGTSRVNTYTSFADVVTAYGSNTEPAKAASAFYNGGFNTIKPTNFMVANHASGDVWADTITELLGDPRYLHIIPENGFSASEQKALQAAIEASTKIKYVGWYLDTEANVADQDLTTDTTTTAKSFYTSQYNSCHIDYDAPASSAEYLNVFNSSYFATVDFTSARPLGQLAFKQYTGKTPTALTDTQFSNIIAKNCGLYSAFGEVGRNIAYKGVTPKGTFVDTIIGAYWLDYNITYNIFDLLTTLPKLSYTNADFNKLYSVIAQALEQAKAFGLIAGGSDSLTGKVYPLGYEIVIPKPEDISLADKQAGVLNNIVVTALLSGNIVKITLTNYLKL